MEIEPLQKIGPIPSKNKILEKEFDTNITKVCFFHHRPLEYQHILDTKAESCQAA